MIILVLLVVIGGLLVMALCQAAKTGDRRG